MTLLELKAHAYDALSNIQMWQKELEATNQAIAKAIEDEKKAKEKEINEPTPSA